MPFTSPFAYLDVVDSPQWRAETELVRKLTDALGMPIDRGIESTVVALRLLGFRTIASCFGHDARATTGPYVMFRSSAAIKVLGKGAVSASDASEREALQKRARRAALEDADSLRRIVDAFEKASSKDRLEVRVIGTTDFRLSFVHAEFSALLDSAGLLAVTRDRQARMSGFARHLVGLIEPHLV